jgi:hypothetical protein
MFKKYKEQKVFPREVYVLLRLIECQPELIMLAKLELDKSDGKDQADLAKISLDHLEVKGYSTARIERCLGLNIGTFNKYKEQNVFPREAYVLLRIIECQPELLTLAKLW